MLLLTVFLLMGCLKKTNDAARFQAYGRYRGAAFRVTDDVKTALIQHKALLESGEMKRIALNLWITFSRRNEDLWYYF